MNWPYLAPWQPTSRAECLISERASSRSGTNVDDWPCLMIRPRFRCRCTRNMATLHQSETQAGCIGSNLSKITATKKAAREDRLSVFQRNKTS